jgi:hypothetical protein
MSERGMKDEMIGAERGSSAMRGAKRIQPPDISPQTVYAIGTGPRTKERSIFQASSESRLLGWVFSLDLHSRTKMIHWGRTMELL